MEYCKREVGCKSLMCEAGKTTVWENDQIIGTETCRFCNGTGKQCTGGPTYRYFTARPHDSTYERCLACGRDIEHKPTKANNPHYISNIFNPGGHQ